MRLCEVVPTRWPRPPPPLAPQTCSRRTLASKVPSDKLTAFPWVRNTFDGGFHLAIFLKILLIEDTTTLRQNPGYRVETANRFMSLSSRPVTVPAVHRYVDRFHRKCNKNISNILKRGDTRDGGGGGSVGSSGSATPRKKSSITSQDRQVGRFDFMHPNKTHQSCNDCFKKTF